MPNSTLLPVGLTDVPYEKSVELYCGRCEDILAQVVTAQLHRWRLFSYFLRKSAFRFLFFDSSLVGGAARVTFPLPLVAHATAWVSSADTCDC